MTPTQANRYKNVMECIVDEEIKRQMQGFSKEQANGINRIDVATYSLNRLPPLYASSREGVAFQYEGQSEYLSRVSDVVQQAFAVVAATPVHDSVPFL
ncbi:MAG: late competence development ComFB family protein [Chloroflexota bacterium]